MHKTKWMSRIYIRPKGLTRLLFLTSICLIVVLPAFTSPQADNSLLGLNTPWTGDFDGMVDRHRLRVLVPYSKTHYFLDGPTQRGVSYEVIKLFEEWLNKELGNKHLKLDVVIIPTLRHQLLSGLVEGRGDIAAGNLTITPERREVVDFSEAFARGIKEIIVTGPEAPALKSLSDLAGMKILVRLSSSYYESLKSLNERFVKEGRDEITIIGVDEYLEDEDLLEMINAGLFPIVIVDDHKANLWTQVFENLTVRPDLNIRTGGEIAWAFRKDSPKLKNVINRFVDGHKQGTLLFNVITKRYLKNTQWIKNALADEEIQRFNEAVKFLKKYSDQYDFDWLMVAALAYQESRIDQSLRSPAGAVGVMQILPSTAKDPKVNISNIEEVENNIHAGVKYLRFLRDWYFEKEPMDAINKTLFSFASYNAGPAKVSRLRREARNSGFDPNVWFQNVEIIAAKRIGRETVQYVRNIYKYYTAYRLIADDFVLPKKSWRKEKEATRLEKP